MPAIYDPVNHVSVGDPTQKAHYDQLLQNAVAVALTVGRVLARAGLNIGWTDALTFTPMPESYEFKLPGSVDCQGLTIRLAGFMSMEAGSQTGTIRLEYFDGAAWVAVANSALAFTTTTNTYNDTVNLQGNLNSSETRYRITSMVAGSGQRMRGTAFLAVKG
jgi:hypothetical protein